MINFIFWALIILAALVGLVGLGFCLYLLWRYVWSIKVLGTKKVNPDGSVEVVPDEVAIPTYFGAPELAKDAAGNNVVVYRKDAAGNNELDAGGLPIPKLDPDGNTIPVPVVYQGGSVYRPYCFGIKWDGADPWGLIRISKNQHPFRFDGAADQRVWSSNHIALIVDISGYWRAPYLEPHSLLKMSESGVPTEEVEIQKKMRDEIVAGMRDILAGYNHEEAISADNIEAIRQKATEFFLRKDGFFVSSGMCGEDEKTFTLGHGELIIRVEQVDVPDDVRADMALPVKAKYRADAAVETARQEKIEVSDALKDMVADQVAAMKKLIPGLSADDIRQIRQECLNQLTRDRTMKKGGKFVDARISNADGTSFAQGSLSEIIGGIVATVAAQWAAKGGEGAKEGEGKRKKPEEMTHEDLGKMMRGRRGGKP